MNRSGWLCLGLLIEWGFGITGAWALTQEEIRSEIRGQMSMRHPGPTGPFWDRLGTAALPVIRQMYSETTSTYEKSWLIDGLSHFSDPSVGELLRSDAEKERNAVMKKKLLAAYVQSQGDASLEFAEPYLSSPDPHIRKAVAHAIRDHVSPEKSGSVLARFKAHEKEPWVLRSIDARSDSSVLKLKGQVRAETSVEVASTPGPSPVKPLSEKELAGEWDGIESGPARTGKTRIIFSQMEERKGKVWRVELLVSKKPKRQYSQSEFEWTYFQTAQDHWLEIRIKKEDTVVLARKPGRK